MWKPLFAPGRCLHQTSSPHFPRVPPVKLLVSPRGVAGAKQAIAGGADIIDCKNPAEGSLGASFPWIVSEIVALVKAAGNGVQASATTGDMPDLPGTAALAAAGLAGCGVDFVKVGVLGPNTRVKATALLAAVVRAAKNVNAGVHVVAAGYADHARLGTPVPPADLVAAAAAAGCDVVMVDTGIKDGKRLLDFMTVDELQAFCQAARDAGMAPALAGRIAMDDLPVLASSGASFLGVRSLVIPDGDRVGGEVDAALVRRVKECIAPDHA